MVKMIGTVRRKKSVSATQRTLAALRKEGYTVSIVEKWNPHAFIRQDMFGFADLVAIYPGQPILAVNATAASEIGRHVEKYKANPALKSWLSAAGTPRFEIWAWRRLRLKEGGKRSVWKPRIIAFHLMADGHIGTVE